MDSAKSNLGSGRKILVTGASGYVGGRLVRQLLTGDFQVRVMVREKRKISGQPWIDQVEVAVANANDYASTEKALEGIHTAFYLLHSINMGTNFDELEATMARNLRRPPLLQELSRLFI